MKNMLKKNKKTKDTHHYRIPLTYNALYKLYRCFNISNRLKIV